MPDTLVADCSHTGCSSASADPVPPGRVSPCRGTAGRRAAIAARLTRELAASSPPTRALLTISAMFAFTDAPSVIAATRASSHGVSAAPATPVCSASRIAWSTASRLTASGAPALRGPACRSGGPTRAPAPRGRGRPPRPPRHRARWSEPEPRTRGVEPGDPSIPIDTTGTPRVSRYSSVRGTSRIALGPGAHDDDRGARELVEVGRDVEARVVAVDGAAMDPADAAGREHPDPRRPARDHRGRDARRSPPRRRQSPRRGSAATPCPRCPGRGRQRLELVRRQADQQPPPRPGRPSRARRPSTG